MLPVNRRRWLIVALVLVTLLTVNAAVQGIRHARRFQARTDEPIQAWMNVGYIARAYQVRPEVVAQAIGLPPEQRDRRPLREIALAQGRSSDVLIAAINEAIRRERATPPDHGGPPNAPGAPPPRTP